jgi:hypothetical protein
MHIAIERYLDPCGERHSRWSLRVEQCRARYVHIVIILDSGLPLNDDKGRNIVTALANQP